jgi:putative ABC transport system ATP-binding protein
VSAGECAAVTGPSGSGKSLFLRMIADLDPNEGAVSLNGIERGSVPAPVWRRQVVYIAAEPGWWASRVEAHFRREDAGEAIGLASALGLTSGHLSGEVSRLSTGERQRLALVRGILARPSALLLDEPTAALDQASVARAAELITARKRDGLIIVLVTHDDDLAVSLGDFRRRMQDRRFAQ